MTERSFYTPAERPMCSACHRNLAAKGRAPGTFRAKCSTCSRGYAKSLNARINERPWKKYRKLFCEQCGFVAAHHSQLDVDHIDADKTNNCEGNLMTLCANCHRLKTHVNKDYMNIKYREVFEKVEGS